MRAVVAILAALALLRAGIAAGNPNEVQEVGPSNRGLGEGTRGVEVVDYTGIQARGSLYFGYMNVEKFADAEVVLKAALAEIVNLPVEKIKLVGSSAVVKPSVVEGSEAPAVDQLPGRRLLQALSQANGVRVDFAFTDLLSVTMASAVGQTIQQACIGGEESRLANAYVDQRKKVSTMDQSLGVVFITAYGDFVVTGADKLEMGAVTFGTKPPHWCSSYSSRENAWTNSDCKTTPDNGYVDAFKNIDGVICACDSAKVMLHHDMPGKANHQSVEIVRGQGDGNSFRSYGLKMVAPRGAPSTDGLTFIWHFERKASRTSDEILKKKVTIKFTHIVEYQAKTGQENFQETWDRHMNPKTGDTTEGQRCSPDKAYASLDRLDASCVVQAFYLDNFKPAKQYTTLAHQKVQIVSDVMGTNLANKTVLNLKNKPIVTFTALFARGDLKDAHNVNFENTEINLAIVNFPFRFSNSTLSIRATIATDDSPTKIVNKDVERTPSPHAVASSLQEGDLTFSPMAMDSLHGCDVMGTGDAHKTGCPVLTLEENLKMSWSKKAQDGNNETKAYKIIGKMPNTHASLTGQDDVFYTGFSVAQAFILKWDFGFTMQNLPNSLHSGVSSCATPSMMVTTGLALGLLWLQHGS